MAASADRADAKGTPDEDRAYLLAGVQAVDSSAGSIPGPVLAYAAAFPIVAGDEGGMQLPVIVGSRWQRGRVVAFGHGGFLDAATLDGTSNDSGAFMRNAVTWLAGERRALADLTVAVVGHEDLAGWLTRQGAAVIPANTAELPEVLPAVDVLAWGAWRQPAAERELIAAWVRSGGGLLAESLGWGWMQLNPALDIREHAGNQMLAPAGILWAGGYFGRTGAAGFRAAEPPPPMSQASDALEALESRRAQMADAEVGLAVHNLTRAIRTLPRDDATLLPRLRAMTDSLGSVVPTEALPITLLGRPLERLALTLQTEDLRFTPADQVTAHAAGLEFPGAVPSGAARVERVLDVDMSRKRWQSTGLYAAPGEPLVVSIAADLVAVGLAVRIGPFTDENWHLDAWTRAPSISSRFSLESTRTVVASAFGGPLYVEVPDGEIARRIQVRVSGAVAAPWFRLGATSIREWQDSLRRLAAPYAELESDRLIISVPSEAIRNLDDPGPVLEFWDDVLDAQADLAARPRERAYPERFVADRQIGYGYMHAGYPIMTFNDVQHLVVDREALLADGSWGHFHELGHNHQAGDWTFDGTGEVTVNLFTMYTYDRVLGLPSRLGGPGNMARLTPDGIRATWAAHDSAGRSFEAWKADPFLALAMYIQMEQAFGWTSYREVFAEYRGLPDEERPKSDAQKRDQWMMRMSAAVDRNLCPLFATWGVPVSQAACDAVAALPTWDPWGERLATPTPAPTVEPTAAPTVDRGADDWVLWLPVASRP